MIKLSTIREVFSRAQMKKAIDIARKSSGDYDKAYAAIEKIKKGLGSEHIIANALKKANESVEEGRNFVAVHVKYGKTDIKNATSALDAAKKAAKIWKIKGEKTSGIDVHLAEAVELDEVNNGLGSFVSQMKLLLKDPKAKKAHKAASSLIMRAQEKGALAKTAVSAIKKALPGLAKKAGGSWERKILGMKTMLIESVELDEAHTKMSKSLISAIQKEMGKIDGIAYDLTRGAKVDPKKLGKQLKSEWKYITGWIKELDKELKEELETFVGFKIDEEVELDEGTSLTKKGDYEVTADGKSSVGVQLSLRHKGKQIVTGTKKDGMFIMAFDKVDGNNKLPKGAEIVKKGKWIHIGFKKVDDVIAYAKFGNITEAVSVDMRTKGYKEAIARGLLRASKKDKKTDLDKTLEDANKALTGKNEDMAAGGSDSTGEIAGKDMPLKKKTLKRFKDD